MTRKDEIINTLAAAVAGLLAEIGDDAVRLGEDGHIVGYHNGCLVIDGEQIADNVTPANIVYFQE